MHQSIGSICWLNLLAKAKVLEFVTLLNDLAHCSLRSLIYALGPWLILHLVGFCGELRVLVCEHRDHTPGLVNCSLKLCQLFSSTSTTFALSAFPTAPIGQRSTTSTSTASSSPALSTSTASSLLSGACGIIEKFLVPKYNFSINIARVYTICNNTIATRL